MRYQLKTTGPVTVVPCNREWVDQRPYCWRVIIMGPTGAGKSTFIEALGGAEQSLGISKDQLAGFTQDVSCYHLRNVVIEWNHTPPDTYPVFLIDTPGFSDSKISELEIIKKVKDWMRDMKINWINHILYLSPITDTRVSGSKFRTIKMLQSFVRDNATSGVTVVTTMWDRLSNTQAKDRAEAHFAQLQDDIWKDLVGKGAQVVRFQNDQESAISIMVDSNSRSVNSPIAHTPISVRDKSAPLLYQELLDRIINSRQEIESLHVDHLQLVSHPDPLLESVVVQRLQEVKGDLAKFLGQLDEFGPPPPGFEGVPQPIIYQDLLNQVNDADQYKQELALALEMGPAPEREPTLRSQFQDAEKSLVEQLYKLVMTQKPKLEPPEGFENAAKAMLKRLLVPTNTLTVKPPTLSPPHTNPIAMVLPDTTTHIQPTSSGTPDGSVASRAPPGDRVKTSTRVKSIKDKITSPFKRGPHH